jgi:hypothetical protein
LPCFSLVCPVCRVTPGPGRNLRSRSYGVTFGGKGYERSNKRYSLPLRMHRRHHVEFGDQRGPPARIQVPGSFEPETRGSHRAMGYGTRTQDNGWWWLTFDSLCSMEFISSADNVTASLLGGSIRRMCKLCTISTAQLYHPGIVRNQ